MRPKVRKRFQIKEKFPHLNSSVFFKSTDPNELAFSNIEGAYILNSRGLFDAIYINDRTDHGWEDKRFMVGNKIIWSVQTSDKRFYKGSTDIYKRHMENGIPLIFCRDERGKRVEQDFYIVKKINGFYIYLEKI